MSEAGTRYAGSRNKILLYDKHAVWYNDKNISSEPPGWKSTYFAGEDAFAGGIHRMKPNAMKKENRNNENCRNL